MGRLFFVGGLFAVPALDGKGPRRFATDRLRHVPITVLLAIALRGVGIAGELKSALVVASGLVSSYGIGWAIGRTRRSGRVV